jgi:hypothetical protein
MEPARQIPLVLGCGLGFLSLLALALFGCAGTQQQTTGGATPAPAAAGAPGAAAAAAPAAAPAAPLAVAVWSAAPGEPMPPALSQAMGAQVATAPGGALRAGGITVAMARKAVLELRCGDALPALEQAADAVLNEVSLPDARPLLSEAYGLMLVCADRVNDQARAEKAAAALTAMQSTVPSDVALILQRYSSAAQAPFGPPRAPVRVETDPPGAVVARDLIPLGVTPLSVPGGNPAYDVLDIEMPGMRKVRRPLASGNELVISLRPEDRPGPLFDRVAQLPLGSNEQEAVLKQIADAPLSVVSLPARRVLVVGPKERGGTPRPEEPLSARIYDLDRKQWSSATSDIAIGPPAAQGGQLVALLTATAPPTPTPTPTKGGKATAAVAAAAKPAASSSSLGGLKLPFAKTKWYTWVIAGGVVALLAGILIADKVSTDKVTVTATH